MLVQSFVSVMESAVADRTFRNASGYVSNLDDLLSESAMRRLDEAHSGCFAFLAFDATFDPVVSQYVSSGSLAADAGRDLMVLFTVPKVVTTPRRVSLDMLNGSVIVDDGKHPAYDYVRSLVPEISNPPLPCLVVFNRFVEGSDPVLVSLVDSATPADLRSVLQTVFRAATREFARGAASSFATRLGADLTQLGITFVRGGGFSIREWLASVFTWAKQNASTVVSVLKMFG
jgi:hypothetical protein